MNVDLNNSRALNESIILKPTSSKIILTILLLGLTACNTDSVSNSDGDNSAPTIVSIAPSEVTTGVSRTGSITVEFSEEILQSTIDTFSFTLEGPSGFVATSVTLDGDTVTLTPTETLTLLTPYTATLYESISDLAGNSLDADMSWSFTTEDGTWSSSEQVETAGYDNGATPQVAFDNNGNAIAVWRQNDYGTDGTDGTESIYANIYTLGAGWGATPTLLEATNGYATNPQISIDSNGNALVVWEQASVPDGDDNIMANYYTAGGTWAGAVEINTIKDNSSKPQVAFDNSGNAIAVWVQDDGGTYDNIYTNFYTAGAGWGTAELVEDDNGSAANPQIAFDNNSNAIAVWEQSDGTRFNIMTNSFTSLSGWDPSAAIEIDKRDEDARDPQIAIDINGNVMVVWTQEDGNNLSLWANYSIAGDDWDPDAAQLIEDDDEINHEVSYHQVAFDKTGNAIVVWTRYDGAYETSWGNYYSKGTGWGSAEMLQAEDDVERWGPQIAFDSNGNGIAVWNGSGIWANRYTSETGWSGEELIENPVSGTAAYQQIAIDSNGNAMAVWINRDGANYHVLTNRFE